MDENDRFYLLQALFNFMIDLRPGEDLRLPYGGKEFADVALRLADKNKIAFSFVTSVGPAREFAQGIAHMRQLGFVKLAFEGVPRLIPEYGWIVADRLRQDPRAPAIKEFAQAYLETIAPNPS